MATVRLERKAGPRRTRQITTKPAVIVPSVRGPLREDFEQGCGGIYVGKRIRAALWGVTGISQQPQQCVKRGLISTHKEDGGWRRAVRAEAG